MSGLRGHAVPRAGVATATALRALPSTTNGRLPAPHGDCRRQLSAVRLGVLRQVLPAHAHGRKDGPAMSLPRLHVAEVALYEWARTEPVGTAVSDRTRESVDAAEIEAAALVRQVERCRDRGNEMTFDEADELVGREGRTSNALQSAAVNLQTFAPLLVARSLGWHEARFKRVFEYPQAHESRVRLVDEQAEIARGLLVLLAGTYDGIADEGAMPRRYDYETARAGVEQMDSGEALWLDEYARLATDAQREARAIFELIERSNRTTGAVRRRLRAEARQRAEGVKDAPPLTRERPLGGSRGVLVGALARHAYRPLQSIAFSHSPVGGLEENGRRAAAHWSALEAVATACLRELAPNERAG